MIIILKIQNTEVMRVILVSCLPPSYLCRNRLTCLDPQKVCDGIMDCPGGEGLPGGEDEMGEQCDPESTTAGL